MGGSEAEAALSAAGAAVGPVLAEAAGRIGRTCRSTAFDAARWDRTPPRPATRSCRWSRRCRPPSAAVPAARPPGQAAHEQIEERTTTPRPEVASSLMEHRARDGSRELVEECSPSRTGRAVVQHGVPDLVRHDGAPA